jgi:hypothetical protein
MSRYKMHGAIPLLPQWLMAWSLQTLPLQLTSDIMELHWHSVFITEEFGKKNLRHW